ncbi:succinate dehydrogenase, cytochrome b556 subunit [Leucobacter sp. GX24907]
MPVSAHTTEAAPAAQKRRVPGGTLYRGNEGMWSWVLHRITGVAIFFFLLVHVLDTALIRVSPEAYNAVIGTYQTPVMGVGEVALVGAIVFHAFNGIRIILVDYWSKGARYQRAMFWIVIVGWVIVMIGFTPRHLINVFGH